MKNFNKRLIVLSRWLHSNGFAKEAADLSGVAVDMQTPMVKISMFIKGVPNGKYIVAYKENIWRFPDYETEADEGMIKEISSILNLSEQHWWYSFGDLLEILGGAERSDFLVGVITDNTLNIFTNTSFMFDPKSSVLVKKVINELGLESAAYSDSMDDEFDVHKREMKGDVYDVVYHGTSTKYLNNILKFGLMPGESKSNYPEIIHPGLVFISSRFDEAQSHSVHTTGNVGGDPMILELSIPDKSLLTQDYDVDVKSEFSDFYDYIPSGTREDSKRYSEMEGDSFSLSREFGMYGYRGRIPSKFITSYYIVPNAEETMGKAELYSLNVDSYYEATPEEASIYAETKSDLGYGSFEPTEYEDEEDLSESMGLAKEAIAVRNQIPLFVYGTLRRGEKNHSMLKDSPFLGDATLPKFVRTEGIGPAIIEGERDDNVRGELYRVDLKTLGEIDEYEGCQYPRELVTLDDGSEAYAYVYREDLRPEDIHKAANDNGISWDDDKDFMSRSKELTNKEHLDDMDQCELGIILDAINNKSF